MTFGPVSPVCCHSNLFYDFLGVLWSVSSNSICELEISATISQFGRTGLCSLDGEGASEIGRGGFYYCLPTILVFYMDLLWTPTFKLCMFLHTICGFVSLIRGLHGIPSPPPNQSFQRTVCKRRFAPLADSPLNSNVSHRSLFLFYLTRIRTWLILVLKSTYFKSEEVSHAKYRDR